MDARGLLVVLLKIDTVLRICLIIFVIFVSQTYIRRENFIQLFTKKSPKAKKKKKAAMLQRQEEGRKGQTRLEGALVRSQICQMLQCARPVPKQACG